MDLGLANLAFETAGMLVWMLLFGRDVVHPATGAGEIFGRPYAAGHPANMRREQDFFQSVCLPQLTDPLPTGAEF
jgi:hypothetical protein